MIGEYIFDVAKVVEGAMDGDTFKVRSYCEQLEQRLRDNGEDQAADMIRGAIDIRSARTMALAHSGTNEAPHHPVPLDADSSIPLADVEYFQAAVEVSLPKAAKATVNDFVTYFHSASRLKAHGVPVSASMLIYGPPGCGKTQLAKHIASQLRLPLVTARSDALISSYLGNTAKNIRMLFKHAAERPCVLFLDELDALGKMRDDQHELGELKRVVISLLQNIDSLGRDHVILAATNHEHLLDPALWRRFAYKMELNLPDEECRFEILKRFLGGRADESSIRVVSLLSNGLNGSELRDIAEAAIRRAIVANQESIDTRSLIEQAAGVLARQTDVDSVSVADQWKLLCDLPGKPFTQEQIGSLYGVDQSTVSKAVTKAKKGRR